MQRLPVQYQRADDGDVRRHQRFGKSVLFQNLRLAPAAWAVELEDDRLRQGILRASPRLEVREVHAVLVRVERHQPTISLQADAGQGIDDDVWRQGFVGVQGNK